MAKRFITPFAEAGDRAEMPDTPAGSDSNYQTGYPSEYEEDPVVNPLTAKFVERDKSNQLYNDITANIKEWQEHGFPEFITSANNGGVPFSYKKNSIVTYLGVDYTSKENSNTDVPPSSKWGVLDFILINDLSQSFTFTTESDYKSSSYVFPVGKKIHLQDRDANYLVISGTLTGNDSDIIASTTVSQSLNLIVSNPIKVTEFGGTSIANSINRALTYLRARANLVPWTITVPQNPLGAAYDWDEQVDLSDDSWVTLKGDGYIALKATVQMNAFFIIGISNKNNETDLSYFSCDCFNFVMEAAVITGSIRGVDVHHIELKASGTGSYTDGVMVGGDSKHTGSEAGAGNEQSTFKHIFDSGDSSVTRDVVHFQGGTSLGVQVDNIRATREDFDNVVGSRNDAGFNGCDFRNIHAVMLTERIVKANSMVNLKGSVISTNVCNLQITGNPNVNNVNYGLLVDDLDATVSSSLHASNLGIGYITSDLSVPTAVTRTHINSVSFNNGDPNSQGVMSTNLVAKEQGGTVWDDTNKTLFVGGNENTPNNYETPLLKRRVQIADDGIFKYTYPAGDYRLTGAIVSVVPEMSVGVVREGLVSLRAVGTAAANKLSNGALFDVLTGALTGTTGIDTHVTVSADSSDGSIYVENRTGAARTFVISWLT